MAVTWGKDYKGVRVESRVWETKPVRVSVETRLWEGLGSWRIFRSTVHRRYLGQGHEEEGDGVREGAE